MQRNLVKGVLTSPKSHQRRRVDMSAQLAATLLALRRHRASAASKGRGGAGVGVASLTATALEERNVRHVFTRMLEKAELRRFVSTTSGTRTRRCCCSRGSRSST